MDDEELEYTLLNKRDVLVYQIPPASSSAGHKADDWKKCIWRGRCRIAGKGLDLSIKMIDASSGQLFAQCVIPNGQYENYVERAIDSSRYFVLKITNGQRHAFIGLGFEERNDAFDFNCTLSDFKSTWVDREKEVEEAPAAQAPSKDLSLKEGQKITINLKGMEGRTRRQQNSDADGAGGFTGLLAPPPPSSSQSRRQPAAPAPTAPGPALAPPPSAGRPAAPQPAAQAPFAPQEDFFGGDFADFQSAGAQPPAAPAAAAPLGMPAPAPAPAPAAVAAPAPAAGGLASQFEQLNLGNALSQPPPMQAASSPQASPMHQMQQPMQPPASQPRSADPFSGIGMFGDSSPKATMAPPQQTTMQFSPAPQGPPPQRARDPFDEFDIFK